MTTEYIIGQEVRLNASFTDSNDAFYDPTVLLFKLISPTGTLSTYQYGLNPEVIRDGVGVYYIDISVSQVGSYHWRWEADGANRTSLDGSFIVRDSIFDEFENVILETGSGSSAANSYVSLAEAETYFAKRLHRDTWDALAYDQKAITLKWASRLLDININWDGIRKTKDQALGFPRAGIIDQDGYGVESNIVPVFVKEACCELALELLSSDITLDDDLSNFNEIKIADISIRASQGTSYLPLPERVIRLCQPYGKIKGQKRTVSSLSRG